ncbi:beta-ketoacyl-ACP synthase [Brevundimonas sp. FT23042]|uniref:beta-ketoacyl-ACP synthase n=1 Tax=Brevundimonas sp. FT23042 TaxID=3393749 RepID=UPI003B589F26
MPAPIHIADYSVACALGPDRDAVASALFAAAPARVSGEATLTTGRVVPVGRLTFDPEGPAGETRTNRILAHCLAPLRNAIEAAKARFGADRIGVVIGTSTSGIGEAGEAVKIRLATDRWPEGFSIQPQQLGDSAAFTAALAGVQGPYFSVSTACTSGGRALASAARLIQSGLCDMVICGGADSLCELTLNGFSALGSLSGVVCAPMSANRDGLNLGEGGALFLLTREPGPCRLAGWGGSVDGHHMSAPDPSGRGAEAAMRAALAMAGLDDEAGRAAVDFIHLHGTATPLNDRMEAQVVARVFGLDTPAASTKALTGHTLGAAGAIQAALCLLAMETGRLPPHIWDGERDPELPAIRLSQPGETAALKTILSASYAFGGNNVALVLTAA